MESFFRKNEHTLKFFALICVAGFTILEYSDFKREQKIQRTIKFNNSGYLKHVVGARFKLESTITKREGEILSLIKTIDDENLSDNDHRKKVISYIARIVKEDEIQAEVLNFFDFYTSLQHCIDSKVCDEDTAKLIYGSNKRDAELIDSYCLYILYYRELWDSSKYASSAISILDAEKCEW